jgi:hypothetical protein
MMVVFACLVSVALTIAGVGHLSFLCMQIAVRIALFRLYGWKFLKLERATTRTVFAPREHAAFTGRSRTATSPFPIEISTELPVAWSKCVTGRCLNEEGSCRDFEFMLTSGDGA